MNSRVVQAMWRDSGAMSLNDVEMFVQLALARGARLTDEVDLVEGPRGWLLQVDVPPLAELLPDS